MKRSVPIILGLLFLLSLLLMKACKKESQNPADLVQKWKVVSMRRPHSSSQQYPVGTYILKFEATSRLSFKPDVNTCEGNYVVSEPGKIKINILACTEICCDSDLARELLSLLPHMGTYIIQDDLLTLSGSGQIKLKSVK